MTNPASLHPAEAILPSVRIAEGRAKLAIAALACTLVSRLFSIAVARSQNALVYDVQAGRQVDQSALAASDVMTMSASLVHTFLLVVTAVLFLRWLHRTVLTTRMLGAFVLHSPKDAVWGFFIPIVSIKRPYDVLKNVQEALLDPALPEPQASAVRDVGAGYRDVQFEAPPPPKPLPAAAVGAWWGMYMFSNVVASSVGRAELRTLSDITRRNAGIVMSSCLDLVSALLAIVMVRGITARLVERYRRVRYSSPEALAAAGVILEPTLPRAP